MSVFVPGQRWISNTESELGLGIVLQTEHRQVTILFPASGETRVYAANNSPLTRVQFVAGDVVRTNAEWSLEINEVIEVDELIQYQGRCIEHPQNEEANDFPEIGASTAISEVELSNFLQFSKPSDRLFNGQIDNISWFLLRQSTREIQAQQYNSEFRGLFGARIDLIPHQIYVAKEVSSRRLVRVLLADEVGLGKTIEAGLILHQLLHTERAQRCLIVVPEALIHQWFVELLRRFNLHFHIFDNSRMEALSEEDNAFGTEQWVLCSLDFLETNAKAKQQATQSQWDVLVVDEAHHLQWQEAENSSPEQPNYQASSGYQVVENIANNCSHTLLLTATPEQLGRASHFARLRLLDPDRFYDYQAFTQEQAQFAPLVAAINPLLSGDSLTEPQMQVIKTTLANEDELLEQFSNAPDDQEIRKQLVQSAMDRHGTGRILFRNNRRAVTGFPKRIVESYALENNYPSQGPDNDTHLETWPLQQLYPELGQAESWPKQDRRVAWLIDLSQQLKQEKVLLICAHASSAQALEAYLRRKTTLRCSMFHEHMDIVERDRAAAYFADNEDGAQLLICSEIGSEGRNFQFAHHLVLFDLPTNPDLLEQRIGRLDRIGQTQDIHIHVPYFQDTAQALLFNWYHQGLNAFTQTCPVGHALLDQFSISLHRVFSSNDKTDLAELIEHTQQRRQELLDSLEQGRDRLLELNSCRPELAQEWIAQMHQQSDQEQIQTYLEQAFDCYGVDFEELSAGVYVANPSNHMLTASFPHLPADGMSLTFDRQTALSREDLRFITWEHPLITTTIEMVLNSEYGNSSVSSLKLTGLPAGKLLVHCSFILECMAPKQLQVSRFFKASNINIIIDEEKYDWSDKLTKVNWQHHLMPVDTESGREIANSQKKLIKKLLRKNEKIVQPICKEAINLASQTMLKRQTDEIKRLMALKKSNPNVSDKEVELLKQETLALHKHLGATQVRLDAINVIVTT